MTASSAATLEFRRASKAYPGTADPAIRELSLEVGAGELVHPHRPVRLAARRRPCASSTA